MSISIVTTSFNQGEYLEATLLSVLSQGISEIDYVVIDGGSSDDSVDIIKKYQNKLSYWVSEPDRDQVHALNKGIAKCQKDIFGFINSDDLYLPGAISAVVEYFRLNPDCDWLCGDTIIFGDGHKTELFRSIVPKSAIDALIWKSHCPQPGMFWRRELLADGFDEKYNYCFDHDFYVKLLLAGHKCHHLPLPLAAYRLHKSSKTVAESDKFDIEFDQIAEKYEPQLGWRERGLSQAIRFARISYQSTENIVALKWLARATIRQPEVILHRPFWGSIKKILAWTLT